MAGDAITLDIRDHQITRSFRMCKRAYVYAIR